MNLLTSSQHLLGFPDDFLTVEDDLDPERDFTVFEDELCEEEAFEETFGVALLFSPDRT